MLKTDNGGFTLFEVILTLAVLGVAIIPLMSILVLSAKINNESNKEYKSFLTAQSYLEEIKAMRDFDTAEYNYNIDTGAYERTVIQEDDEFRAEICIRREREFYYLIDIIIIDNGEVVNMLRGSMIVNK